MGWVITHNKLSVIAWVFTIKSHYSLSGADYDSIIERVKNMLLEGNRLKENFYAAKSIMKPLSLWYQKKLICVQTFTSYTTMDMQILSNAKPVSMLGTNLIVVEEGHLSHTKN
jgi:hypothetical protein